MKNSRKLILAKINQLKVRRKQKFIFLITSYSRIQHIHEQLEGQLNILSEFIKNASDMRVESK